MVGILVSYWEGLFSGAMLVSGRVPLLLGGGLSTKLLSTTEIASKFPSFLLVWELGSPPHIFFEQRNLSTSTPRPQTTTEPEKGPLEKGKRFTKKPRSFKFHCKSSGFLYIPNLLIGSKLVHAIRASPKLHVS